MFRGIASAIVVVFLACGDSDADGADAATERDQADTTQASPPSASSATSPAPTSTAPVPPAAEASRAGRGVCSLATEAEVTDIIGQPMKFGPGAQRDECLFIASSGDPNVSATFQVHPTPAMYDQLSKAGSAEPVSGVGDRAVIHTMGASSMVAAAKGGRGYLGSVYNAAQQGRAKQQATELAKRVVGRM